MSGAAKPDDWKGSAMTLCAMPLDERRRERLLLGLDIELLDSVMQLVALIDRTASPEARRAVALPVGELVDLARDVSRLPAQTADGDRVRNAIPLCCRQIAEIVTALDGG